MGVLNFQDSKSFGGMSFDNLWILFCCGCYCWYSLPVFLLPTLFWKKFHHVDVVFVSGRKKNCVNDISLVYTYSKEEKAHGSRCCRLPGQTGTSYLIIQLRMKRVLMTKHIRGGFQHKLTICLGQSCGLHTTRPSESSKAAWVSALDKLVRVLQFQFKRPWYSCSTMKAAVRQESGICSKLYGKLTSESNHDSQPPFEFSLPSLIPGHFNNFSVYLIYKSNFIVSVLVNFCQLDTG